MSQNLKKCPNLIRGKDGEWRCKSTHICYRSVCYSDIFETVTHGNGKIITTSV